MKYLPQLVTIARVSLHAPFFGSILRNIIIGHPLGQLMENHLVVFFHLLII